MISNIKPIKGASAIRILFVDDENEVHQKVIPILNELGFTHIETAIDGDSAYLIFRGKPSGFDLIITDFSMPGMDGVTLLQKIIATNATQHCLILTSHAQSEEVKKIFYKNRYVFLVAKKDIYTDKVISLRRTLELINVNIQIS